tara:strand:- start:65 stop:343 length:279 start_codon:yes stop_codon:yes gene_type:complete
MKVFLSKIASLAILLLVLTIRAPYQELDTAIAVSTKDISQTNSESVELVPEEDRNLASASRYSFKEDEMRDLFGDEQVFPFVAGLGKNSGKN